MFYPLTVLLVQRRTSPELQGEALKVFVFWRVYGCVYIPTHISILPSFTNTLCCSHGLMKV